MSNQKEFNTAMDMIGTKKRIIVVFWWFFNRKKANEFGRLIDLGMHGLAAFDNAKKLTP